MTMAKEKLCPKCGEDITDTKQEYDPSVGIDSSGWYCDACEHFVEEEDYEG